VLSDVIVQSVFGHSLLRSRLLQQNEQTAVVFPGFRVLLLQVVYGGYGFSDPPGEKTAFRAARGGGG